MTTSAGTILLVVAMLGCGGGARPTPRAPTPTPVPTPATPAPAAAACDLRQGEILREADALAAPWSTAQHLARNFPDGRVAWLMKAASYTKYVVELDASRWGRCDDTGCYVFVAPAAVIHAAVERSMADGRHDPAVLGQALGLPAANFDGPLRMMTLDLDDVAACARLPVERDPGVWKCASAEDTACFAFGGYTSGGIPELIVIDAPVAGTTITPVP